MLEPLIKHQKSKIDVHQYRESEISLLRSLIRYICQAPDFNAALAVVLRRVCEVTGWNYGEAWIPRHDGAVLECSSAWYGSRPSLAPFRQVSEAMTFAPNKGLPGRVWISQQPEWIPDVSIQTDAFFLRAKIAKTCGLRAGFGIPIINTDSLRHGDADSVIAVLVFFMEESGAENPQLVELVEDVAAPLGLLIQLKLLEEELKSSEARYRCIVEDQTELICRYKLDGKLTFVNDATCRYFGKRREQCLGQSFVSLSGDEDCDIVAHHLATLSLKNLVSTREEQLVVGGEIRWLEWTDRAIASPGGQLIEFQSVGRDITASKLAEKEREQLASFPELNPNPIVEVDLAGNIRYINSEAAQALPELEIAGVWHPFLEGVVDIAIALQREGKGSLAREVKVQKCYYEQVLHYVAPDAIRIYAFEITQRKLAEEQLIHNAFYDHLTGLPNRALFMDRLGQAIARAKQHSHYLSAVLFVDLNRFKMVNDSLGHQAGDQLLGYLAQRLLECLRPTDTLARLGGDEFAILLEEIQTVSDATRVAESIQQALNTPFYLNGHELYATASIGVAYSTTGYEQPEDLLRDADIAMYHAKAQGKGCYEVFDRAMYAQTVALLQLENDLRRGIERQEFQLHYQPIVSLSTGKITGFEALVRWNHPERGLVPPVEFIPLAEETGLIFPLGWWILEEACRQLAIWQQEFPSYSSLSVNVNLSVKQFSQPDFLQKIDQILQKTGLEGRSLKLEITESLLQEKSDWLKSLLYQLQKRNIQLCIDDFGTGYSSLSRLHNFPINILKVDRSFVSRLGANGENSEIVQAIVMLAHHLGMEVVAEGVESSEQAGQLRALQSESGQGYFFSRPLDIKAVAALLGKEACLKTHTC